jgi:AhpD family alkylhydroperoxidase
MHLHDWNAYRRQLVAAVGDFAKLSPDTVKGYVTLGSAGQKVGRLGNKTRELIALAAAISLRCDGCIAVHAAAAREHGATKEEISEALAVAVGINAGAAVVYSTRALDAFDAAGEASPPYGKELSNAYLFPPASNLDGAFRSRRDHRNAHRHRDRLSLDRGA